MKYEKWYEMKQQVVDTNSFLADTDYMFCIVH